MRRVLWAVLLLGAAVVRGQGGALPAVDWDAVEEEVQAWVPIVEAEFNVRLAREDVEGWLMQLRQVEFLIREGDLLEMSDWAPLVREAFGVMDGWVDWQPYADWLRQRVDYTDLARFLVTREAARPAGTAPVRAAVNQNVLWRNRMRARPAPRSAEAWVPVLKPLFEREGVPGAWVWIAEVESSFNPEARSPVGAAGLFQFMPRTGESLGLSLAPVDERLIPEKSAVAAAQYLRQLYGRFEDWPLVLAAYNAGQGRVAGLVRRHGASFEAIAPHLPTETRMYVPKVLAAVEAREGVDGRTLPAPR